MRRENIYGTTMIDLVAEHIGIEPGSLSDGSDAGQNTRCDFRADQHLADIIKHPNCVAITDAARPGIDGVYPDLLRANLL